MTRTMFDSVTLSTCPTNGDLYACYVDGLYRNDAEARSRFPGKRLVTITVNGRNKANIVDIELGDCTPQSGVASVKAGIAEGCYMSASVVGQVCAQIDAQGVSRDTPLWTAHYTGTPHLCGLSCYGPVPFTPNIVATQWLGDHNGYDASLVADYWPGVDPAPEGDDMTPDECRTVVREELQRILPYALGYVEGQESSVFNLPGTPVDLRKLEATINAIAAKLAIKP